jgi:spermidine/putrescine transport system ATP-binding protein
VFAPGSEVWVAWRREHTFGLDATARVEAAEAEATADPDRVDVGGEAA